MSSHFSEINPENTLFIIVAFEGPDPYSLAGGLGVRVNELSEALATAGYETHHVFVGDPERPAHEQLPDGRQLWRCCQELAAAYPTGVYAGEEDKAHEFARTVPHLVLNRIVRPAQTKGKLTVILGEDWHTSEAITATHDQLYWQGLRSHVLMLWNANSVFGFSRIDWKRLQSTAQITAVSRYMKQLLWDFDVNPLVIPNGIPERHLEPVDGEEVHRLREAVDGRLLLAKFARFDPDKNWLPAVQAIGRLRTLGERPLMVMRGGIEGYGMHVLSEIENLDLARRDLTLNRPTNDEFIAAVAEAHHEVDVLFCRFYVPEEALRLLYRASDAVLANSAHEPFGLVGLEVMATQGIAFVGATGEGYAQHLHNAISLDTSDPNEIVGNLLYLDHHPHVGDELRRVGRLTARYYIWPRVIEKLVSKLQYMLMSGTVTWPTPQA